MDKHDLAQKVKEQCDISGGKANDIIGVIFETIESEMKAGGMVKIHNFGKFIGKQKVARKDVYMPYTGERKNVPAYIQPQMKFSASLKKRLK